MKAKHTAMMVLALCALSALACLKPKNQAPVVQKPECKAHTFWSELDRAAHKHEVLKEVDEVCGERLVKNECSTEVYCWSALQYSILGSTKFTSESVASSTLEHLSLADKATTLNIDNWKLAIAQGVETRSLVRISLMTAGCDDCATRFEQLRSRLRVMPDSPSQRQLVELFVITDQLVKLSRSIDGHSLISYSARVAELKHRASEQISRISVTADAQREPELMKLEPTSPPVE